MGVRAGNRSGVVATGVFVLLGLLALNSPAVAVGVPVLNGAPRTAASVAVTTPGPKEFAALDRLLADRVRSIGIPGAAVVVVTAKGAVHRHAIGDADEKGRTLTVNTPVMLASTSKAITALAVMRQVDRGKLDLDAPVTTYLPWFRVAGPGTASRTVITVRNLLGHTSGLPAAAGLPDQFREGSDALADGVRRIATATLERKPGTDFGYANANYEVLGLVVQAVAGQPFADVLREDVFAPLGMTHSFPDLRSAGANGLAQGSYPWFGRWWRPTDVPRSAAHLPSATMYVSAGDLGHTLSMHLGGGQYDGAAFLSRESVAAMQSPVSRVDDYTTYAMGWFERPLWESPPAGRTADGYHLPMVLDHEGDWSTTHSYAALVPHQGWGVAMVVNGFDPARPSRLQSLDADVLRVLTGHVPAGETGGDELLQRYGAFVSAALLAAELVLLAAAIRVLARRRRTGTTPPWRRVATSLAWLVPDLGVAWLALSYVPEHFDTTVIDLIRRTPDVAISLVPLLVLVLLWAPARTVALLMIGGPQDRTDLLAEAEERSLRV